MAALACLVWILGFELVPNVHVGMHEAFGHHHHGVAPDHTADAAHVEAHEHGHEHEHVAEHDHEHAAEHEHDTHALVDATPAADVAACESMQDHGRHSLAHRGVVAMPAPWALAPVATAPWTSITRACTPVAEPRNRRLPPARARGPPVLT